ncbi:aldo/keto reductase [Desulfuribacillus alkaliarsenatis]|uniref:4Fe-4S ferredoxin-type domain-containing protein n=1 Tax=Desulfuribacillus alkaliarsenatis TaxID=766136 RepID=A0A1E5G0K1_9FIRM|nr:aldo/keto reductase [Desulfuribacillus alkaliarsenatis]OEF96310.1 hypothetical protein BHF68_09120 [Desulfuribacillus alkaliarsenatis]
MEHRYIGSNKLKVSRMCLGTLTMGPLQRNLSIEEGANIIVEAVRQGVNILDTAELYQTYPYIKRALEQLSANDYPHIISKSYAYSADMMKYSLDKALNELGVEQISVFLLHEQESEATLKGHSEAYEYLLKAKEEKLVQAVGISCHSIEAVYAAAKLEGIDCIMPIYNQAGIGIIDGNRQQMTEAISAAHRKGIGIIGMKALAGGHLIPNTHQALDFVLGCDTLDTIAIGVQNLNELMYNVAIFNNQEIHNVHIEGLQQQPRSLLIEEWCTGCAKCVKRCTANALTIHNNRAIVNHKLCRLCGYCGSVCPHFFIKVL